MVDVAWRLRPARIASHLGPGDDVRPRLAVCAGAGTADALTLGGLLISALLVLVAAQEGRWLLLAAVITAVSGVADNIDGAVAVLTDRATRFGYVLDSVVDRVSDALYLVALWVVGAPAAVCVLGGVLMLLQEYLRARAATPAWGRSASSPCGSGRPGWPSPRCSCSPAGCSPAYAVEAATAAAAAWVGLGVVGFTRSSSSSAASSASGFLTRKDHGLRHGLLGVSCP